MYDGLLSFFYKISWQHGDLSRLVNFFNFYFKTVNYTKE